MYSRSKNEISLSREKGYVLESMGAEVVWQYGARWDQVLEVAGSQAKRFGLHRVEN